MKSIFLLNAMWLITVFYCSAQVQLERSVVAAGGAYAAAGGISLSYTIGELATTTLSSGSLQLTQGFQQPDQLSTSLPTIAGGEAGLLVYPNPTSGNVVLQGFLNEDAKLILYVYDLRGRLVMEQQATFKKNEVTTTHIKTSTLAPSVYILRVTSIDDGGILFNHQIIRTN